MRIWKAFLPLGLVVLLSGCPELSLNPLFKDEEAVFDDALVGTWITSAATRGTVNEGQTYTLKESGTSAYELTFPNDDGTYSRSKVHLARLGNFLFLDVYPAELTSEEKEQNKTPELFPLIGAHTFGRIWIEKDFMRIALLNDEWVQKMAKEGELTLSYAWVDNDAVLTASTEEIQKLALQYAEDTEAFSQEIGFCRQGQLQDTDCEIALLKQRVAIKPNDQEAWYSLGQAHSKLGRDDEALAAFNRAAQLDASSAEFHHAIGRTLLKKSQYEQARTELQEAARLSPSELSPIYDMGLTYFLEARFPDAGSAFERLLPVRFSYSRTSGMVSQIIIRSLVLTHIGKQAEARELLRQAEEQTLSEGWAVSEMAQDSRWALLRLAYQRAVISEAGMISQANTPERKLQAYFDVGYQYFLQGNKEKALEYFQKALDTKVPDSMST
jgi:tetratricopeptide (TPR) repeat protein